MSFDKFFSVQLEKLKKTVETATGKKKGADEKGRKTSWSYKFQSVDESVTVTIKSTADQDWIEDEEYKVSITQPHHQTKLDDDAEGRTGPREESRGSRRVHERPVPDELRMGPRPGGACVMPDLTTPANMVRELPIDKMGLSYDGVDLGGFPCIRSMEAPRVTT